MNPPYRREFSIPASVEPHISPRGAWRILQWFRYGGGSGRVSPALEGFVRERGPRECRRQSEGGAGNVSSALAAPLDTGCVTKRLSGRASCVDHLRGALVGELTGPCPFSDADREEDLNSVGHMLLLGLNKIAAVPVFRKQKSFYIFQSSRGRLDLAHAVSAEKWWGFFNRLWRTSVRRSGSRSWFFPRREVSTKRNFPFRMSFLVPLFHVASPEKLVPIPSEGLSEAILKIRPNCAPFQ